MERSVSDKGKNVNLGSERSLSDLSLEFFQSLLRRIRLRQSKLLHRPQSPIISHPTSNQKRIARAFLPNRTCRAVAADELHVVGPFHQFGFDGLDERFMVSAGQVCSADGA